MTLYAPLHPFTPLYTSLHTFTRFISWAATETSSQGLLGHQNHFHLFFFGPTLQSYHKQSVGGRAKHIDTISCYSRHSKVTLSIGIGHTATKQPFDTFVKSLLFKWHNVEIKAVNWRHQKLWFTEQKTCKWQRQDILTDRGKMFSCLMQGFLYSLVWHLMFLCLHSQRIKHLLPFRFGVTFLLHLWK